MSLRFLAAVAENPHFTASEKLVLLCLADHADEEGLSWPSIPRIEHWTSLTKKTILTTLKRLEGLPHSEEKKCVEREKKQGVATRYRLNLAELSGYVNGERITEGKITPGSSKSSTRGKITPGTGGKITPGGGVKLPPGTIIEPTLEKKQDPPSIPPERGETKETLEWVRQKIKQKVKKQPKPSPSVSPTFIARMEQEYSDLWAAAQVQEIIAEALNHKAVFKTIRVELYVQGWLRREAERKRAFGPAGGNHRRSVAAHFDDSHVKYLEIALDDTGITPERKAELKRQIAEEKERQRVRIGDAKPS